MSDHSEKADEVERELDGMQHESERLGGDISEARDDWEQKKRDHSVPGAGGEDDWEERDAAPPESEPDDDE